jgi:hypothetical protein
MSIAFVDNNGEIYFVVRAKQETGQEARGWEPQGVADRLALTKTD